MEEIKKKEEMKIKEKVSKIIFYFLCFICIWFLSSFFMTLMESLAIKSSWVAERLFLFDLGTFAVRSFSFLIVLGKILETLGVEVTYSSERRGIISSSTTGFCNSISSTTSSSSSRSDSISDRIYYDIY